ncbi:MAG: hypothetical protein ACLP8S_02525 [Solirubrobacteraceae bacterium]
MIEVDRLDGRAAGFEHAADELPTVCQVYARQTVRAPHDAPGADGAHAVVARIPDGEQGPSARRS